MIKQHMYFKKLVTLSAALIFSAFSLIANAGTKEDIQALFAKKDYDGAVELINSALKKDKNNESLLLQKGLALVRADKLEFAAKHYKKLKRKLKGNPEPGNNLAMVYRMQGEYSLAIKEFNKSIKAHPDYVRAYENLGDTYVLMAQKEYQRGVDATKNGVLASKVNLSQNFHRVATQPKAAPQTRQVAKQAAPKKAAAPAQKVAKVVTPRQQVFSKLQGWVSAWSNRKTDRYLSHYSNQFKPDLGLNLQQWVDRKKRILANSNFIKIDLSDIKIEFTQNDAALASFTQKYASDGFNTTSKKTLKLQKFGKQWLIMQEISEDA